MYTFISKFRNRLKGTAYPPRVFYLADYRTDIEALPTSEARGTQEDNDLDETLLKCSPGSSCKVTEDSSFWILNNQNEWVEQESGSSGSGSGGETALTLATSEEILALFGWGSDENG